MTRCQICEASVEWKTTPSGLRIPIDPLPNPKGPLGIWPDGTVRIIATEDREAFRGLRYTSHWATCPAAQQRKGRDDG
jgi:hypothetical protein